MVKSLRSIWLDLGANAYQSTTENRVVAYHFKSEQESLFLCRLCILMCIICLLITIGSGTKFFYIYYGRLVPGKKKVRMDRWQHIPACLTTLPQWVVVVQEIHDHHHHLLLSHSCSFSLSHTRWHHRQHDGYKKKKSNRHNEHILSIACSNYQDGRRLALLLRNSLGWQRVFCVDRLKFSIKLVENLKNLINLFTWHDELSKDRGFLSSI